MSVKHSELSNFSIAKTMKRKSFVKSTGSCTSTKTRTFKKVNQYQIKQLLGNGSIGAVNLCVSGDDK